MVEPLDEEEYESISGNMFSKQGVFFIFNIFWARMYELGKFKLMIPNRVMFYFIAGGVKELYGIYIYSCPQ